jgi:hypothetical protein
MDKRVLFGTVLSLIVCAAEMAYAGGSTVPRVPAPASLVLLTVGAGTAAVGAWWRSRGK